MATKTKISAAQAAQVYGEVPGVLRKLASERDQLRAQLTETTEKLASYQNHERIEKIARHMEDKNINLGLTRDERVSQIKEAHAKGRSLDAIEAAVDMTAPNGEFAKVASDESGSGANQLESFLLGDLSE